MKNKKIKILYTIPNFDTAGSGKVVYDLVNNLDKDVFEPEICCFHNGGSYFEVIKTLGVKIHIFQFTANYKPFLSFPLRVFKIVRFFKKHQFDIIHSWHWSSDFSEVLAVKLTKASYVYTKKSMSWGNRAWKWKTNLSTKIITINSDMKRLFYANKPKKVVEIPIGIDTNYYHPQIKKHKTPEGIKFKESDFIIVSISNLLPIKGVEILIQAVNALQDKNIKLCIVGKDTGVYADELKELAANNTNIYFLGQQLDVRPYHAIADVFAISSLDIGEGLGVAPIEAMASERIVIGSDVSGVKDVLSKFPNCLFEPNNVNSLKNKIKEIQSLAKEEKIELQVAMRKAVESHFSKEAFISNHEKLYKELAL